jgi:hypothetical protein
MFAHVLPSAVNWASMTHFWATSFEGVVENSIMRYYVDGETVASLQFNPALACGMGWSGNKNKKKERKKEMCYYYC